MYMTNLSVKLLLTISRTAIIKTHGIALKATTETCGKARCKYVARALVAPNNIAPKAPRIGDHPPKMTIASAIQPNPRV